MSPKRKILVIDDQLGVRRLLYETFIDEYQVELAANGREALQKAAGFQPDLILIDMKMPGLNGLETYQQLDKIIKGLPAIMMTAYGELDLVQKAKSIGVRDFITKPFDLDEIKELVKKIFNN